MPDDINALAQSCLAKIADRSVQVGIIGMGYVGLPLAVALGGAGIRVCGFDVDPTKAEALNAGQSYIKHIAPERVASLKEGGLLEATSDMDRLGEPDALLICVPTPLTRHLEPDLSFVVKTTEAIAQHLRPGQIVILESTTYPGTTADVMKPFFGEDRPTRGRGLFPRLFSGARRPWQSRFLDGKDTEGRGSR